jgi:uncharacterized protein
MRAIAPQFAGLWKRGSAGRESDPALTTVFFATDLHGSEVCFRKFVNAAEFYGADVLILGGDLTGKFVVAVVEQPDGSFRAELFGSEQVIDAGAVDEFERAVADQGLYGKRMSVEEHEHCQRHPEMVDALFEQLIAERLTHWIELAKEKLEGSDVRILCAPGNDDPFFVDEIVRAQGGERVLLLEGEVIELAPGHQMLSTGYSNLTPWHTHRELPEPELRAKIDAMAETLDDPATSIFNIHVPPYDSGLDSAPDLNEDLSVKTSAGAQLSAPAGSTAVREAIEHYQPLVSLHGHIHEADGSVRIGRTVAMNAGSEYSDGRLRGVLFSLADGDLARYQATTG